MSNFMSAVRIILGIGIIIFFSAACFLSFWFFVIKKLPTSHNTVRYLRKRIPPHAKGINNLEEQLRLLEEEYSNEISAVRFRDTDNSVLGGYCSWFTKTSVMCQEYAYLLITQGDDLRLQNAFQYSLAHERGHSKHAMRNYGYFCVSHWVDEVQADIDSFLSINTQFDNVTFTKALASYRDSIDYKIDYQEAHDKRGRTHEHLYTMKKYLHPSWENRYEYISMLQEHSADEILSIVEDDCRKWYTSLNWKQKIEIFFLGEM